MVELSSIKGVSVRNFSFLISNRLTISLWVDRLNPFERENKLFIEELNVCSLPFISKPLDQ